VGIVGRSRLAYFLSNIVEENRNLLGSGENRDWSVYREYCLVTISSHYFCADIQTEFLGINLR
jgi:hypothetical protein